MKEFGQDSQLSDEVVNRGMWHVGCGAGIAFGGHFGGKFGNVYARYEPQKRMTSKPPHWTRSSYVLCAPHDCRTIKSASNTTCWIGRSGFCIRASNNSAAAVPM